MTWRAYEEHVAEVLRGEGWTVEVTPPSGDGGVDVLAERGGERLGVQAKMYGSGGWRVNAQVVRELYGAACCEGCTRSMIATDGSLLPDARTTAKKLGVLVRHIDAPGRAEAPGPGTRGAASPFTFASVWNEQIVPLEGRTVVGADGSRNDILEVDSGGIVRRTSGGGRQRLEIEIFEWTVERLLRGEVVTQREINDHYVKRASTGVARILASLNLFESTTRDGLKALRLTTPAPT